MRDGPRGKQLKVYHISTIRTLSLKVFASENSLWYSNYRVCGGFALRDKTHFQPLDVIKNLWGEGGAFPKR
jgi:hypothetical protein